MRKSEVRPLVMLLTRGAIKAHPTRQSVRSFRLSCSHRRLHGTSGTKKDTYISWHIPDKVSVALQAKGLGKVLYTPPEKSSFGVAYLIARWT